MSIAVTERKFCPRPWHKAVPAEVGGLTKPTPAERQTTQLPTRSNPRKTGAQRDGSTPPQNHAAAEDQGGRAESMPYGLTPNSRKTTNERRKPSQSARGEQPLDNERPSSDGHDEAVEETRAQAGGGAPPHTRTDGGRRGDPELTHSTPAIPAPGTQDGMHSWVVAPSTRAALRMQPPTTGQDGGVKVGHSLHSSVEGAAQA